MKMPFKLPSGLARRLWHSFMYRWIKHYKAIFFVLFLIVAGVGGFQWYYHLERYRWTEEEKKSFLERTVKETAFQEAKFKQVLSDIAELDQAHRTAVPMARDLFFGKVRKSAP